MKNKILVYFLTRFFNARKNIEKKLDCGQNKKGPAPNAGPNLHMIYLTLLQLFELFFESY
jgi:hypothetical protein